MFDGCNGNCTSPCLNSATSSMSWLFVCELRPALPLIGPPSNITLVNHHHLDGCYTETKSLVWWKQLPWPWLKLHAMFYQQLQQCCSHGNGIVVTGNTVITEASWALFSLIGKRRFFAAWPQVPLWRSEDGHYRQRTDEWMDDPPIQPLFTTSRPRSRTESSWCDSKYTPTQDPLRSAALIADCCVLLGLSSQGEPFCF